MKKALKSLLIIIFGLCPILLAACGSTNYYTITVNSSDTALGSVSKDKADSSLEDTKVTLFARENNPETNPLLGWVKDNEYLVKIANHTTEARDNKLELTSSAAAEGHYTAVFKEDLDSMMYAYISQTHFDIFDTPTSDPQAQDTESFSYKLSYAILSSGSNNYIPFEDKIGQDINTNILYFGGPGQNFYFKFKIELSFNIGEEENIQTFVLTETAQDWISKEVFPPKLNFEFKFEDGETEKNGVFTIILSKFSEEMFEIVTPKQEENK
ncbi:MAG: hypothetical protein J6A28_00455 [Clostridia bacterium]|nr:hypothetical protein [Clostridia bacterium]